MRRNPYGWDYPPGAEFHPDAPWNQVEQPAECCLDCEHFDYDEDEDTATCRKGELEINGPFTDYPSNCPYDRRDELERYQDYLADQADNYRKYGKEDRWK